MMGVLSFKSLPFGVNEPSLYPRNVVGILKKLIFLGSGIFLNNHESVVFAWIFCMRNMTCLKMGTDVSTFLYLALIYIPLCLQCHIIMFFRSSLSKVPHLFLRRLFNAFLESLEFLHQTHVVLCPSVCASLVPYPCLFESLQRHKGH